MLVGDVFFCCFLIGDGLDGLLFLCCVCICWCFDVNDVNDGMNVVIMFVFELKFEIL